MKRISFFGLIFLLCFSAKAQEELMDLLESETQQEESYVSATFKSTRVINGHSIETRSKKVLEFVIGHRFGTINSGYEEFWGLDFANIRLGLEYGLTDHLNIGIGRSSYNKVIDSFLKYRLVRQTPSVPVTITALATFSRKTAKIDALTGFELSGVDRNTYTAQMLIARKFTTNFSLQLMPTLMQRNLVATNEDANLLISMGIGGRYKISNRVAIVGEYYPQLSKKSDTFQNAVAFGVDIETGGHVFQLHFTNAVQMNERGFLAETTENFWDGGIHYGFNISRVFDLGAK